MRSFVLGNGKSRLHASLTELKQYGAIYGCNALYREFIPDFLVAVDPAMVLEINKSGFQFTRPVWTNANKEIKECQGFNYFTPRLGWSSGPSALHLASTHLPKEIYILGFDYVGSNGYVNNVYADTENYKKSSDTATYFGNWKDQTERVIQKNAHIQYYRVVDEHNYYSLDWDYLNFAEITYAEFNTRKMSW